MNREEQKKMSLHEEITRYVAYAAGSEADVDEALEAATLEHLLDEKKVGYNV